MGDHIIIMSLQQIKQVISGQEKETVLSNRKLKFIILSSLSNAPAVMHELSSILQLWIHYKWHEFIFINKLLEYLVNIFHVFLFFLIFRSFFILLFNLVYIVIL